MTTTIERTAIAMMATVKVAIEMMIVMTKLAARATAVRIAAHQMDAGRTVQPSEAATHALAPADRRCAAAVMMTTMMMTAIVAEVRAVRRGSADRRAVRGACPDLARPRSAAAGKVLAVCPDSARRNSAAGRRVPAFRAAGLELAAICSAAGLAFIPAISMTAWGASSAA
jgi:hypothetical protein